MKLYKKLEIDNLELIQKKVHDYIYSIWEKPPAGFEVPEWNGLVASCPELMTAFDRYGLKPIAAAASIVYKQYEIDYHIDYIDANRCQCRINIPIINCENSFTEFGSGGEFDRIQMPNGYSAYKRKINDPTEIVKIGEVTIDVPTVIRVQIPHRIRIDTAHVPRICLTVFMDRDPVFLLD